MPLTVTQQDRIINILQEDYRKVENFFANQFADKVATANILWEKENAQYVKLSKKRKALYDKQDELKDAITEVERQLSRFDEKPLDKDISGAINTFIEANRKHLEREDLVTSTRQYGINTDPWTMRPTSKRTLDIIKGLMRANVSMPSVFSLFERCRRGIIMSKNMDDARDAIALFYTYDWKSIGIDIPPTAPHDIRVTEGVVLDKKQITYVE